MDDHNDAFPPHEENHEGEQTSRFILEVTGESLGCQWVSRPDGAGQLLLATESPRLPPAEARYPEPTADEILLGAMHRLGPECGPGGTGAAASRAVGLAFRTSPRRARLAYAAKEPAMPRYCFGLLITIHLRVDDSEKWRWGDGVGGKMSQPPIKILAGPADAILRPGEVSVPLAGCVNSLVNSLVNSCEWIG